MPTLVYEEAILAQTSLRRIAGLDEAGRGALAGPVVAAAVVLPLDVPQLPQWLHEVNDSKQLSPPLRERLYACIMREAAATGVGIVPPQVIDAHGIIPATRLAMQAALAQLPTAPDYLLIDGRIRLAHLPTPQQSLIRGDSLSFSIAAASILAKVTRDRLMVALDGRYPHYGFARHKGYATRFHRDALAQHGPCPEHRHSFAPIRRPLL